MNRTFRIWVRLVPLAIALSLLAVAVEAAEVKIQSPADQFGWSVAIDGDLAAVGSPWFDSGPAAAEQNVGSVLWLRRDGSSWTSFTSTRLPATTQWCTSPTDARYGWSVSISGDHAAVGAPGYDFCEGVTILVYDSGSVTTYQKSVDAGGIHQMSRLQDVPFTFASDPDGDRAGTSVSLGPSDVIFGAPYYGTSDPGSALTSHRTLAVPYFEISNHVMQTKPTAVSGAKFGEAVALHGSLAVVGAPNDFGVSPATGSARVFVERADHIWTQEVQLDAFDGRPGLDAFGTSVAVHDWGLSAVVAVGAPWARNAAGTADTGAVYLYERSVLPTLAWQFVAKVTPSDGVDDAEFGRSLAIDADGRLVVGAPGQLVQLDGGGWAESGAVYVFERVGNDWVEVGRHAPSDADDHDLFGWSVSFDGEHVLVGAPGNAPAGSPGGAAYFYDWSDLASGIFADDFETGDCSAWSAEVP